MSDAEYRLLIQRSFDEELSKQEHRALINHLETSSSGQKFHHQLDQMIQAAQDTPLPDELRPQNPESLARQIMEQLPQKKSSIFGFLSGLLGGGKAKSSSATSATRGKGDAKKDKALAALGKGDKAIPARKIGKKEKAAEVRADEIESQVGTFSRLKSIGTRADIVDGRDAQSTTRSLGEKFLGMPGQGNLMDEAPLTLAESIKRKVSESQKLSPLDDEDDDASGSQDYSRGGGR